MFRKCHERAWGAFFMLLHPPCHIWDIWHTCLKVSIKIFSLHSRAQGKKTRAAVSPLTILNLHIGKSTSICKAFVWADNDSTPSLDVVHSPLCLKSHRSSKAFCALVGAHLFISPLSPLHCMNCLLALGQQCSVWLEIPRLPHWRILLPQKVQLNSTLLICLSTAKQQLIEACCAEVVL